MLLVERRRKMWEGLFEIVNEKATVTVEEGVAKTYYYAGTNT